ncbi:MAG TPA: hypothetical protein VH541_05165 [Gaiellaceae bacterium]
MNELDIQLSEIVLFELPSFEAAQAFRVSLRPRWAGWSHNDEGLWLFAAELGDEPDAVALLLREAQELLADLDLLAVVFVLDGRSYVLPAAEPAYERSAKQAA